MRKMGIYLIIFFQILLIISLVQGIHSTLKSRGRVAILQDSLQALQSDRQRLTDQLKYVQSPFYLEEVARDQLHLTKPGETVVMVPEGSVASPSASPSMASSGAANYQKWWEVITGQ